MREPIKCLRLEVTIYKFMYIDCFWFVDVVEITTLPEVYIVVNKKKTATFYKFHNSNQ